MVFKLIQLLFIAACLQNLSRRRSNTVSCVLSKRRSLMFLVAMLAFYLAFFLLDLGEGAYWTSFFFWLYLASSFLSMGIGKKGIHYMSKGGLLVQLMTWEEVQSVHLVENNQGVLMININGKRLEQTQQYPAYRAEHVLKLAEEYSLLIL
ncbi:MAG: hypothetical protein Q4E37_05480 [Tissierellia bacterium]|nr:hypothetical protein [Tissierellia bacterium]